MGYSKRYLQHFTNPQGVGELDPFDKISQVEHQGGGCFDKVKLTLQIDDGKINDAMFRARACSGTIAACSALIDKIKGMELEAAKNLTSQDLIDHLEGVPEKKLHSVELAVEALKEALV